MPHCCHAIRCPSLMAYWTSGTSTDRIVAEARSRMPCPTSVRPGRMPERTNGTASKAVEVFGPPWVRIPLLPQRFRTGSLARGCPSHNDLPRDRGPSGSRRARTLQELSDSRLPSGSRNQATPPLSGDGLHTLSASCSMPGNRSNSIPLAAEIAHRSIDVFDQPTNVGTYRLGHSFHNRESKGCAASVDDDGVVILVANRQAEDATVEVFGVLDVRDEQKPDELPIPKHGAAYGSLRTDPIRSGVPRPPAVHRPARRPAPLVGDPRFVVVELAFTVR